MAESIETPETVVSVEKPSRVASFRLNHPRTAKVVGIAAITAATLGVVQVVKNRRRIANATEAAVEEFENTPSS